ncbi:MAG TPA: PhzF family phenazine biosynthesis protein [Polyangia bacterium]|jgi:PhzF family phenazine biosynthesis protein|nr:PhzF family phenazine biosynthesis protein [Polyangia bacterium]
MPSLPLYQVDAFTHRAFAGNPAAICPLDGAIPEALMQDIAAENNLSETAFFHRQGDVFDLRWFTPTVEVELCGHATLASAFVIMTELEPGRAEVAFHTKSGTLTVRREKIDANGSDLYVMDFPSRPATPAPELAAEVAAMLDVRPVDVLRGPSLLAVLETADDVRRLKPDFAAIAREGHALCVTAPADAQLPGVDFVSRYFAPAHGIPEDPVTGSSYTTLAPYWAARLGKPALRARQVSVRGGDVRCEDRGARVLIAGQAALVIKGTLTY